LQEQDAQQLAQPDAVVVTQHVRGMLEQQPVAGQVGAVQAALAAANAVRDPVQRAAHLELLTVAMVNIICSMSDTEGHKKAAAANTYIKAGIQPLLDEVLKVDHGTCHGGLLANQAVV